MNLNLKRIADILYGAGGIPAVRRWGSRLADAPAGFVMTNCDATAGPPALPLALGPARPPRLH